MGNCWGAPPHDPANTEISQKSTHTSSRNRSDYGKSRFPALNEDKAFTNGQIFPTPNLRIFSLAELKSATRNFTGGTVLGEGDSDRVFKGWIDQKIPGNSATGTVIAVRILTTERLQKSQEWQSEINYWGRLSHPNVLRLLGYCWEDGHLYLVSEFMMKGSLWDHLLGRAGHIHSLPWDLRLKMAVGAARGLVFLHTLEKQVIYGNFRATNILLDGSYTAKISDFGFAKVDPSRSQVYMMDAYAAPEFAATGQFNAKSDVYSFGVFLLEMISGRRALDINRPMKEQNLVDWAKPFLCKEKKLFRVMDTKLEGQYSYESAQKIAQLVLKCLEGKPNHRPEMKQVVQKLEQLEAATTRVANSSSTSRG
ncbi:Protein kinase [Melia azedarach]|uniref:Protein kinase n=1 Tax=Melia azedarach TaxID=155640 RepID=A0ACC1XWM8_MELAZ|nr:Protein kinase [Melia azedarach]